MRFLILCLWFFSHVGLALSVGDKAPDFSLKGVDGKQYSLKAALKKHDAAAVIFVATECPYSNAYNKRYNDLDREFKKVFKNRATLLAINPNDTEPFDSVKKHAKKHGFTFVVLKDPKLKGKEKVSKLFGAERTPEVFLVNKKMKIIYHGRIDNDTDGKNITRKDLVAAVDEYLAGKPITKKKTKAFGCTIKNR